MRAGKVQEPASLCEVVVGHDAQLLEDISASPPRCGMRRPCR
jgi:hypothetical protein